MAPAQPSTIGHFQVLGELGRGGMGIVYRVKDTRTAQLAALKIIPPESLARPDSALRFKREFRAMQRVEHPNVIRVFEAGTHDACPYFTMELIDGRDIRRWLDGDEPIVPFGKDPPPAGTLSEAQRARLNDPLRVKRLADAIVQVGFALAAIHSHRIVHRDLKPDNILVSKASVVKLMDFGIAKQMTGHSEHSSGGMVVGTFKYLSPEQALGADVDGRADLYCLGIILYELLAGRHPFYSENSVGYAYHHARKPPPPMDRFNPEVHKGLKAVCERLIKKDPRERFPTAEDVIAAVREAMDGSAVEVSTKMRAAGGGESKLPFQMARDQLFQPALIGRATELKTVQARVEELLDGRGHVVAVTGPRGIGKTRLVREVAAAAKSRNVEFLWGKAVREGGTPYQPYLGILEHIVMSMTTSPTADVRRMLGDEGRILARYLPCLEQLATDVRPRPAAALEPEGERIRFLAAVSTFLQRTASEHPRVLVLDDIHFADELSLGLTRHLVETLARPDPQGEDGQRFAPITLVVTLDPADPGAGDARSLLARFTADSDLMSLALPPLTAVEVREMLVSMIGGSDVAQALADYLHAETQGVPGAVEERVRAWADSGELRRRGRRWVLQKQVSSHVPPAPVSEEARGKQPPLLPTGSFSNESVGHAATPIMNLATDDDPVVVELRAATRADIPLPASNGSPQEQRVARLTPMARDVAERMAVAGERVSGALLERIALRPEDELLDALDELIKRNVVADDKVEALFNLNADDRRVLLAGLSRERGQQLHRIVARACEEEARRSRKPAAPEELARHYLEGGEPLVALDHLLQSARVALAASATRTAADRVREAQDLFKRESAGRPLDQRLARCDVELVLLRLDVLAAVGEHRECVSLATRRIPRLRDVIDSRLVGEALLRLAASERVLGDLDAALEHVGEVLAITERGGAHALRCRAKSLCGLICEQRGQLDRSERYYSDALELARAIGDDLEEERARSALARRRLIEGDLPSARRDFQQLLSTAEQRGEKLRITGYVDSLALIAHEEGHDEEAEIGYRRLIQLAKPAGDRRLVAVGLLHIGIIRRDQRRFDDALSLMARAARVLGDIDNIEGLAAVHIAESRTLLDKGDAKRALDKATEAFDQAEKAASAFHLADASICRGLALVHAGSVGDGLADITRGLHAARVANANRIVLEGLLAETEARKRLGEDQRARESAREGAARAESTGHRRFAARFTALAARLSVSI